MAVRTRVLCVGCNNVEVVPDDIGGARCPDCARTYLRQLKAKIDAIRDQVRSGDKPDIPEDARLTCAECGHGLSDEERRYLHYRCNNCEVAWMDRLEAWRQGSDDPELDAALDGPGEERRRIQ